MNAVQKLHEAEEIQFAATFDAKLEEQAELADALIEQIDGVDSRHDAAVFISCHADTVQRAEAAGLDVDSTVELLTGLEDHRQVKVDCPYDGRGYTHVDRGIAALLQKLWARDIPTINSCQENQPGIMWIEFANTAAAEAFLGTIAAEDRSFYVNDAEEWDLRFVPDDVNEVYDEDSDEMVPGDTANIVLRPSIRFPKSDYRRLLRIFK